MPERVLPLLLIATGLAAANLLQNPGFEQWPDDSTPEVWRVEQRSRTSVTRELDTVGSGLAACRLVRLIAGAGENKGVLQRVAAQPGVQYHYVARCLDDASGVSLGMVISWRSADSSYIGSTGVEYSIDQSGWQMVRDSSLSPAGTAFADVILRTYGETGAPAGLRVLCDDAVFDTGAPTSDTLCLWFFQDSLGRRLVDFFDGASASIDYCCYNSSRTDVTLALINAHDRGVDVRVITDNTRLDDQWVAYLRSAGVEVWSDSVSNNSSNYMHNKFAIRDFADADSTNDRLWNASYNPNLGETHADYALELPSTPLCRAYLAEFNQMWGGTGMTPNPATARFHSSKSDVLPTHNFTLNGYPCRLYFSPQNRVVDTVARVTSQASGMVAFAVNAYTFDDLGYAMVNLFNAGRTVFGTFDRANVGDSSTEYYRLRDAGLPVLVDSFPYGIGMVHEKIMVIDSLVTVCGSANWSNNANVNNDENTLLLYDPELARRFLAEIVARYVEAGGTYPPAVSERPASLPGRPGRALASPGSAPLPAGIEVFDALGRRVVRRQVSAGVYFVRTDSRRFLPAVLVR